MKILFTGGGTAGHVNPALAVAAYIKSKEPNADIRFAGASGAIEEKLVARAGFKLYTFPIAGLSRKLNFAGIKQNISALQKASAASKQAKAVLREFKPDIVFGTGGYASFPAVRAATSMGVKCIMMEVNATPGVVVKKMAGKANCVLTAFEETAKYLPKAKKIVHTGSPVRMEIEKAQKSGATQNAFGAPNRPLIVSFWGSVGALYMNQKMSQFIKLCADENKFSQIHAAGASNYKWMPEYIENLGLKIENAKNIDLREYIYNMEEVLADADLVICRAGASTLAEICACGKPSIIVPSPYVADNHQEKNARVLEKNGAAIVITEKECTGELLYKKASELLADKQRLEKMGKNAAAMSKNGAVERIYNEIGNLLAQK